jgi:proline iminopeptidase
VTEHYPAIEPYDSGFLDVGGGHQMYWETVGDPEGTPAVLLHGGPGGGCSPNSRRNFDPAAYRAVLFDQRSCGRSTPSASLPDTDLSTNTTQHLVDDIERLRTHLGIERWVVVGVSWGVTLGLVYAERHPDRVIAMVLAAVTSGTQQETDWITRDMGRLFPREWDEYVSLLPPAERAGDLCSAYARILADPDPEVRRQAAHAWCVWEDTHMSLMPGWEPSLQHESEGFQLTFARLVTHYWGNRSFLEPDEVMRNVGRLSGIPAVLIHGRYDVSGPLETAWRLHHAWPDSRLIVLEDAGHGGGSFTSELVGALDNFSSLS